MDHPIAWTAPPPFWTAGAPLARPQILRFASDEFMEQFLATLEQDPAALAGLAAFQETWRGAGGGAQPAPERWLDKPPQRLLALQRRSLAKARAPGSAVVVKAAAAPPLKLFQPAHQRHYLVAASLVCQQSGLPDREIDAARHAVGFVVRRLLPRQPVPPAVALPEVARAALWDEYAYTLVGSAGEWRRVGAADDEAALARLLPGEERLPLFPARYTQDDGHGRRLFAGSVPVGRREVYQGAVARSSDGGLLGDAVPPMSPRVVQFHTDVLGPWKALLQRARNGNGGPPLALLKDKDGSGSANIEPGALRALRSELQMASWYLLQSLRAFLALHLRDYLRWLGQAAPGALPAEPGLAAFHQALATVVTPAALRDPAAVLPLVGGAYAAADVAVDLPQALRKIDGLGELLDQALTGRPGSAERAFEIPVDAATARTPHWPGFLFLFADPWHDVPTPVPSAPPRSADDFAVEQQQAQIDALGALLEAALPAPAPDVPTPAPTLASVQPADLREAWYVMRLVYERPDCAPAHRTLASQSTQPFQMAGFFDPDAPARPIRIGLPLDLSPAGLRKFDKNTVLVMSDMLCGHIDRFKGITFGDLVLSVLPFPFHKDLAVPAKGPCKSGDLSLGVMCSLSIPIITICALILLMIIVSLLDAIFRWLPFFAVCFPLPGFKGRKDN